MGPNDYSFSMKNSDNCSASRPNTYYNLDGTPACYSCNGWNYIDEYGRNKCHDCKCDCQKRREFSKYYSEPFKSIPIWNNVTSEERRYNADGEEDPDIDFYADDD